LSGLLKSIKIAILIHVIELRILWLKLIRSILLWNKLVWVDASVWGFIIIVDVEVLGHILNIVIGNVVVLRIIVVIVRDIICDMWERI